MRRPRRLGKINGETLPTFDRLFCLVDRKVPRKPLFGGETLVTLGAVPPALDMSQFDRLFVFQLHVATHRVRVGVHHMFLHGLFGLPFKLAKTAFPYGTVT